MSINKAVKKAKEIVKEIVEDYEEGRYTKKETVARLCELATVYTPEQYIKYLPEEYIKILSEYSYDPPPHPEDVFYIEPYCGEDFSDRKEYDKNKRELIYKAATALHNYFHPNIPLRNFEKRKYIGIVEEIIEIDGHVVVLGDIESCFIREHFVELVRPDGFSFISKVINQQFLDPLSSKSLRYGLFFSKDLSFDQIVIGTRLWVLRH